MTSYPVAAECQNPSAPDAASTRASTVPLHAASDTKRTKALARRRDTGGRDSLASPPATSDEDDGEAPPASPPATSDEEDGGVPLARSPATGEEDGSFKIKAAISERDILRSKATHPPITITPGSPRLRRSLKWERTKDSLKAKHILRTGFGSPQPDSLCERCEALDLDAESFVIGNRLQGQRVSNNGPPFLGKRPMGNLSSIKERKFCPVCRLLVRSLADQKRSDGSPAIQDLEAQCEVHWTVDGKERVRDNHAKELRLVERTRRLCIEWSHRSYDKAYVVLVAPQGRFAANGSVNADGKWEGPTLFLGRLLTSIDDSETDLVAKWLKICKEHHGPKCDVDAEMKDRFVLEVQKSPFFTVVDVQEMCLKGLPDNGDVRYVALSHSWQSAYSEESYRNSRVTLANLASFDEKNSLSRVLDSMPNTVRDSIYLTRCLGIRYLWADTLCIVQDSSSSWNSTADIIDVVYANAELTVVAVDGDDAQEGFNGILPQQHGRDVRLAKEFVVEYRKDRGEPIQLLLSRPLETYLARSQWNKRAWTLQERLLSRRSLFYVEGRLFYECRSSSFSEEIFSEDSIAGSSCGFQSSLAPLWKRLPKDPLSVYKDLLQMYTMRNIWDEREILSAFSGVRNMIGSRLATNPEFIFGLPNSHFDWALLWQPEVLPERRIVKGTQFPSWSWCGWRNARINYDRTMVSGPEMHLHEWLSKHTWITYYIRDGQGYLRLVWDPLRHKPHPDLDPRLQGYDSPRDGLPSEINAEPDFDYHGRPFDRKLPRRGRVPGTGQDFELRISPMQRRITTLPLGQMAMTSTLQKRPNTALKADTPYLQFFTWHAKFYLAEGDDQEGNGLRRFAILDARGDFAGTCILPDTYTNATHKQDFQEFIALSEAKDFDDSELGRRNLYSEQDQDEGPWNLFNVMMLSFDESTPGVSYRAGLGKMYKWAFEDDLAKSGRHGGTTWKEIVLG